MCERVREMERRKRDDRVEESKCNKGQCKEGLYEEEKCQTVCVCVYAFRVSVHVGSPSDAGWRHLSLSGITSGGPNKPSSGLEDTDEERRKCVCLCVLQLLKKAGLSCIMLERERHIVHCYLSRWS